MIKELHKKTGEIIFSPVFNYCNDVYDIVMLYEKRSSIFPTVSTLPMTLLFPAAVPV